MLDSTLLSKYGTRRDVQCARYKIGENLSLVWLSLLWGCILLWSQGWSRGSSNYVDVREVEGCPPAPPLCSTPPPLPCFIQRTQASPTFLFLVGFAGEAMTSLGPLPSVETRYATRQPNDTSGTFHGTPWLWGEPFSPTWPGPVRDGPVPQETCASADPAGPAAGGPKSEPQVR